MTRRSRRELERELDELTDQQFVDDDLLEEVLGDHESPTDALADEIEEAFDVLPPELCDELEAAIAEAEAEGWFKPVADSRSKFPDPTEAYNTVLDLVHGEAVERQVPTLKRP